MKKLSLFLCLLFVLPAFGQWGSSAAGPFVIPAKSKGTATVTVAATDSDSYVKLNADYRCDGTADDVQIQAAMDSLPAGGGKVWCAAGNYVLTGHILVPSNCTLEFEVGNTIKVAASGTHTLDAVGSEYVKDTAVTFSALILNDDPGDGGSGNTNIHIVGAVIDFESPVGATKFAEDISYAGIWLDQCTYSSIEWCKVSNVVYDANAGLIQGFGILVTDSDDILVADCSAYGNGYEGIGIRAQNNRVLVENCHGDANGVHLIQAASLGGGNGDMYTYITFRNCYADDMTNSDNNIIFHGTVGTGVDADQLIMDSCKAYSFCLYGHLSNVNVTNCQGGTVELKTLQVNQVLKNVNIVNNNFGVPRTGSGVVKLYGTSTTASTIQNVLISGNHLHLTDNNNGVYAVLSGAYPNIIKNVSVVGNFLDADAATNSLFAICIQNNGTADWSNFLIDGNQMWGDDAYTSFCVIQVSGTNSTGDIRRVRVSNNLAAVSIRNLVNCAQSSGSGVVEDVQIDGNLAAIVNTYAFCKFTAPTTQVSITNNKILTCKYILEQATGAVSDVIVKDNIFDSITTSFSTGTISNLTVLDNNVGLPIVKTANFTARLEHNGATYINTGDDGAMVATLPAAVAGLRYIFVDNVNTAGVDIAVTAAGTDEIYDVDGTTSAGAGDAWHMDSDAYTELELICYRAGYWNIIRKIGTIHDND